MADIPESVIDAVAEALGDAYDCTRVWSAWSCGTMGPDDFALVSEDGDRVAEIAGAAIGAAATRIAELEAEVARLRAGATRLGQDLACLRQDLGTKQKVIGMLRADAALLDRLEAAWFWQTPEVRARLATSPCWSAGEHDTLRSALRAAFRMMDGEVAGLRQDAARKEAG